MGYLFPKQMRYQAALLPEPACVRVFADLVQYKNAGDGKKYRTYRHRVISNQPATALARFRKESF